ncbi:sialic acid-binding Ig-like lectin 12 isoform X1 [Anarhichas minor]|uniref:sialic acid-binding Ig-like lectin 12 isoform X1 n=1 Tax=Anarhichas minor TaxID=65739 RepID=UPI003F732894
MSLTAAASGFLVLLLTLPVIQGQDVWGVTYTPTEVCAVKGSTVTIRCSYTHPYTVNGLDAKAVETFWFTKTSNDVYVDLRTDPEYSGRVESHCVNKVCTLMIRDLRESDSAEYKFRFTTNQPDGKYTGSPGVSLSVTDLQVHVSRFIVYESYNWAEMTCQSSCLPPGHSHYVWFKNGEKIRTQTSIPYSDYFYPAESVSCAVGGYEAFSSPSVLIQSQSEWGVTYTPTEVCAFKGSKVNMRCRYTYPSTTNSGVQNTFWFTKEKDGEPVDPTTDSQYSRRVQHRCDHNDCTLTIRDLRKSDSADYKFRFTTNQPHGKYTGSPGVTLSVTDPQLQINVRRSTLNSTWTELTCQSKCQLPKDVSYIWYQNGEKRKEEKVYFHPHPLNPADNYSCAIKGHEMFSSPSVYAPKLPSVSVSPSAEIVEGSSVTLTCSSDANPAANYTWYKEDKDSPKSSGQIFNITDFRAEHSGSYSCEAQNNIGRSNSTLHLTVVAGSWKYAAAGTMAVVLLAVISLSVFLWIRKKGASRDSSEPEERPDNREQVRIDLPDQGQQEEQEEQEELQYASVHFSNKRADPLYSSIKPAQALRHTEQQDVAEYAAVQFNSAPRIRGGEDPAALYSTVNKTR